MSQQTQIFQRMCEWHRVEHIPIFKENICLPLTKDQWVTIIILNNSQVPEMTMIKYSKQQQRKKNQRSRCREQRQNYIRSGFIQNARNSGKVPAEWSRWALFEFCFRRLRWLSEEWSCRNAPGLKPLHRPIPWPAPIWQRISKACSLGRCCFSPSLQIFPHSCSPWTKNLPESKKTCKFQKPFSLKMVLLVSCPWFLSFLVSAIFGFSFFRFPICLVSFVVSLSLCVFLFLLQLVSSFGSPILVSTSILILQTPPRRRQARFFSFILFLVPGKFFASRELYKYIAQSLTSRVWVVLNFAIPS